MSKNAESLKEIISAIITRIDSLLKRIDRISFNSDQFEIITSEVKSDLEFIESQFSRIDTDFLLPSGLSSYQVADDNLIDMELLWDEIDVSPEYAVPQMKIIATDFRSKLIEIQDKIADDGDDVYMQWDTINASVVKIEDSIEDISRNVLSQVITLPMQKLWAGQLEGISTQLSQIKNMLGGADGSVWIQTAIDKLKAFIPVLAIEVMPATAINQALQPIIEAINHLQDVIDEKLTEVDANKSLSSAVKSSIAGTVAQLEMVRKNIDTLIAEGKSQHTLQSVSMNLLAQAMTTFISKMPYVQKMTDPKIDKFKKEDLDDCLSKAKSVRDALIAQDRALEDLMGIEMTAQSLLEGVKGITRDLREIDRDLGEAIVILTKYED